MREKRAQWKESVRPEQLDHLVFPEDSGVNTNLTRLYGRNLPSKRVIDYTPLNTPKSTTVLSSILLSGEKVFTTYAGGTTGKRFVSYLRDILIPTLKSGTIVIMDNMRSHYVKAIEQLLHKNGILLRYLPPYSPDLNPIEMMWSKMKAILRKWKIRKPEEIQGVTQQALAPVVPDDVHHWFAHSGNLLKSPGPI